jgi:hypothetical protein
MTNVKIQMPNQIQMKNIQTKTPAYRDLYSVNAPVIPADPSAEADWHLSFGIDLTFALWHLTLLMMHYPGNLNEESLCNCAHLMQPRF